jgi:DNA-binding transcriptional regulator GbsR (MarR family)
MADALDPTVEAATLRVADAVGALIERWGFKRNMGRVWALLYLEQTPHSQPDLCERLTMSSGAMSMILAELQQWGVVHKAWVPGERREYYQAETSIWKMVSRVLRERELRWIQDALEQFTAADGALGAVVGRLGAGAAAARAHAIAGRVTGLTQLARVGAHLIEAILSGESVDALPIKTVGDLAKAIDGSGSK